MRGPRGLFRRLSAVLIAAALRERIARLHWRTMRAKSQSEQRIIPGKRSALTKPVCWQRGQVIARSGMAEGIASLEGRAKWFFGGEFRYSPRSAALRRE